MITIRQFFSKIKNKKLTHHLNWVLLILGPLFIVLCMETIHRGKFSKAFDWISTSYPEVLLNGSIVAIILWLIYAIIGRIFIALSLTMSIVFLFALISKVKLNNLGVPLLPWDLLLNNEATDIMKYIWNKNIALNLIVIIIIIIAVGLVHLVVSLQRQPIIIRLVIGLLSCACIVYYIENKGIVDKVAQKMNITTIGFEQQLNYEKNGILLAFMLNIKYILIPEPDDYSKEKIEAILNRIQKDEIALTSKMNETKPNVIVIMNEAFWDPTNLQSVKFDQDPMPTIRNLSRNHYYGELITPQYGGGTANTEFGVLTGNSMLFLPGGSVPYQQYVNRGITSLASLFKQQGYIAKAIHPYHSWFWNRTNVYRLFGFDHFMGIELFPNPEYKGPFISDNEVTKTIINDLNKYSDPLFVFAVTMQNHGPYGDSRYEQNEVEISSEKLTSESLKMLRTYTQGVRDADESIRILIEEIEKSDEPTIVVFFGDHLPLLGDNYKLYKEDGFIESADSSKWSLEEKMNMHSTPLFIWSNTDIQPLDQPVIGSSFLGAKILKLAGIERTKFFHYVDNLSNQFAAVIPGLVVKNNGELSMTLGVEEKQLFDEYKLLQYDNLFGKKYASEDQISFQSNNVFHHIIELHEVIPNVVTAGEIFNAFNGQAAISVKGNGFTPSSIIYMNDVPLKTTFGNEKLVTALVPDDMYKKPGTLDVSVQVKDSKGISIMASNSLSIQVNAKNK